MATARTGIEPAQALADRPLDRGVVADIEVEVLDLLVAAPVTAPQALLAAHAQRHGDRHKRITAVGAEQHQVGTQVLGRVAEEFLGEVFAAPGPPASAMLLIEAVHALQHHRRNLLPHQWAHREARLRHGAALTADVAPLVGIEAEQVVVEAGETGIAPEALLVEPGGPARCFRQGLPAGIDVQQVAAQQPLLPAEAVDLFEHQAGESGLIFIGGHLKAVPLHRAHRAHPHQLWVVAQAHLSCELGEGLIENEFAVAVALQVERRQGHQRLAAPDPQMAGLPSLTGNDAAGGLQTMQPAPAEEGDAGRATEFLPLGFADPGGGGVPAGLEFSHAAAPRSCIAPDAKLTTGAG